MTRNLFVAALITLSVASTSACGKTTTGAQSSSPPTVNATAIATPSTTATPAPRNVEQLCNGLTWPRPMPAVVGLIMVSNSREVQPLTCLKNVQGIRPDGSVIHPHPQFNGGWKARITAVSPPPGALVGSNDPVTINLVPVGDNEQPAYHPCDWVTAAEATGFVGGTPLVASDGGGALQNAMGSTDLQCEYFDRPDFSHSIISELRLTGAHIVDAASEYAFKTGEDSTTVSGVGIKAACTWPQNYSSTFRQLFVLLPGERIYVATGRHGESCDTLKKFAQAAIPRIGP